MCRLSERERRHVFYIMLPYPLQSAEIGIILHEIVADVVVHTFFQRMELHGAALAFKPGHVGLGEILVLALEVFGHVEVFDILFPVHGGEHGARKVVPAAGMARAHVEDAVAGRRFHEPDITG